MFPHCMVLYALDLSNNKDLHSSIKYRCQKNLEPDTFIKDLDNLPQSVLDAFNEPADTFDMWTSLLEGIILHTSATEDNG